jgi:hypothetical protein
VSLAYLVKEVDAQLSPSDLGLSLEKRRFGFSLLEKIYYRAFPTVFLLKKYVQTTDGK